MTRNLIVILALGILSACEQYREPTANCFNLVSRGPTSVDCEFTPLPGPETTDEGYE